MRPTRAFLVLAILAACGDDNPGTPDGPGPDAAVDAPTDGPMNPNPFEGMFDSPDDFPREGCVAGSLAGFAHEEVWPPLGLRTEVNGGQLVTFIPRDQVGEQEVPHTLTADDLLISRSTFNPNNGRWQHQAIDVCNVMPDGTLIGHSVFCFESTMGPRCFDPFPFNAPPLHRIAGESEASGGLSKVSELALEGHPVNVRVGNGHAYLPMLDMGMRIVSLANPAAPVKVGWWLPAEDNFYNDVKLMTVGGRRYAVLAGAPSDVVDVTDPAAPFIAASLPTGAHTLDVEGTLAYFVGSDADLRIYDLAVPTAPVLRAEVMISTIGAGTHDLHVKDGIAYVSVPYEGLAIVDCTDPSAPVLRDLAAQDDFRYWHSPYLTTVGGRPIAVHGDEIDPGRMTTIDLDPKSPTYLQELGEWLPRDFVSLHNIMAIGARVYMAHYQDGVRVFDISDPTTFAPVAYFNTWDEDRASAAYFSGAFGLDLDPANRRIYVADSIRGLFVLEGTAAVFP
jgi:hypothetical protein